MDIPNLATNPTITNNSVPNLKVPKKINKTYLIIVPVAIIFGFLISRVLPTKVPVLTSDITDTNTKQATKIIEGEDVKVGITYGNLSKNFGDSAMGTIKSGGVNGEGTHTLIREGGITQNAALTSSVVDLDLFIDKKVEVKGETNDSNKAGWFMDVGSIKILE